MPKNVAQLVEALTPDPWRAKEGFSRDIEFCHAQMLQKPRSDEEISSFLKDWLADNQPCLFGRLAAGDLNLLNFCILTERDLRQNDTFIRDKIQEYRTLWKIEAAQGLRSGFVILATSATIASAIPDKTMMALACRLCFLYLREDEILPDEIYTDNVGLEIPDSTTKRNPCYGWRVGVNLFVSAGDKRWWHDHRIPGGLAFSMNSVGHMARNGALRRLTDPKASLIPLKGKLGIDSLSTALKFAMLTISGAQPTPSGPATCLRELDQQSYDALTPKCPFAPSVPPKLRLKDYKTYHGWYHTDVTIPSDYFDPSIQRPERIGKQNLDFTYLFDDSIENPAFETMGTGGRIV